MLTHMLALLVGMSLVTTLIQFNCSAWNNEKNVDDKPLLLGSKSSGNSVMNGPTLTIVITAHPIPSHPSLKHLDETIESLNFLKLASGQYEVVLACDAPTKLHDKYQKFKENVREKYPQIRIIETPKSYGICNNMKTAFAFVETKYVLTVQHDMPFARPLELMASIDAMERFPHRIKFVRFNQNQNSCRKIGCDMNDCKFYREQRFPVKVNQTNACMALIRTACWNDNNHLTTVEYYNNLVFPRCAEASKPVAMEHVMTHFSTAETHNITGTYIYGSLEFPWQVEHEDGSETRPKNHKRRQNTDSGVDYDLSQYSQKTPLVMGDCVQGESF